MIDVVVRFPVIFLNRFHFYFFLCINLMLGGGRRNVLLVIAHPDDESM